MNRNILIKISSLLFIIIFQSSTLFSQLQTDSKYGFKINIPSNWSKYSYMDGTDKVYDYMSPDENAAVQIRVFDAPADFTTALLAQVYEESMLPAGSQKLSLNEYTTVNGIPCKKGVYLLDYNGNEVGLSAIYIVQNNKGYVLTALIPNSMIQQKGEELKGVTNSFSIDGFQAPSNTVKKEKKPSGLGGLMGSTTNNSQPNSTGSDKVSNDSGNSLNGQYKLTKRSDGLKIMYYKTIDINTDGSYTFKMQNRGSEYVQTNVGKWILNGNILTLKRDNSDIVRIYTVTGDFLYRSVDNGDLVYTFNKQ